MTTYLKEDFAYDANLVLEDSLASTAAVSAIVASQEGKVLDVAKIVDLGDGLVEGYMIVDIDAIDVDEADESYFIKLQAAQSATFATAGLIRDIAHLQLGAGELLGNATATTGDQGTAGERYVVPFRNEIAGVVYRYVRVYQLIANGTGESITDTIWLSIKRK